MSERSQVICMRWPEHQKILSFRDLSSSERSLSPIRQGFPVLASGYLSKQLNTTYCGSLDAVFPNAGVPFNTVGSLK